MLEIALHNSRQHLQFQHAQGVLWLARSNESPVWTPVDASNARRASALVEISSHASGVGLMMAGCEAKVSCDSIRSLTKKICLSVPAAFGIGDTRFEIFDADRLDAIDDRPLERLVQDKVRERENVSPESGPSPATISRWFMAIGSLNRWAASLQELYVQAVRCAVEAIGLDGAVLVRHRDNRWEIAASHLPHPEFGIRCDMRVLDELLSTPLTLFHGSERTSDAPAVVVSPLRSSAGELIGAIYGYRSVRTGNARRGIRYLEAHTIELLAAAVSEGIARLEREAEVDRRRVLMEQALAASRSESSRRMNSEEREVSLVFADLRGSTQLIASLEMDHAYELLGDVMDCLTAAVLDHDGLVIDYYGDGLAAMWNAPADQFEHPELACRAALRMLETLPEISADWAHLLSAGLQLGIGVHTGQALVGNAGSRRRSKYGPRGPSVHLASRVEAASKELQLPLIVTQSTADRLSNRFTPHRICRARLRGVEQIVDLFTIATPSQAERVRDAWEIYDSALRSFERGELHDAARMLQSLDQSIVAVPHSFLAGEVQRALGGKYRRRSTDGHGECLGVITLGGSKHSPRPSPVK